MKKKSQGFTLLEMIVALVIVGVLGAVFAPSIADMVKSTKATKLKEADASIARNWMLITQKCGVTSAAASNPIPATGKKPEDVIFGGVANVATAYQNCYTQSSVIPLTQLGEPGAAAGSYNVAGYGFAMAGGGTSPLQLQHSTLPDEVTKPLVQLFNPNLDMLAASDTTNAAVQYSAAAADSTRTVTLIQYVN